MSDTGQRPRLAFVGLGWIGRHRLQAVAEAGVADICALVDSDSGACDAAAAIAPAAKRGQTFSTALEAHPSGVVLATPSALHAEQAVAALQAGAAVFCQKPLGRTAAEATAVIDVARAANLLVGVDFSYRHSTALRRLHNLIREGALGEVFALDLVFHNAYGPDKPWFYDVGHSGGGCLLDLGIHLVDFLHWALDGAVERANAQLFAGGRRLQHDPATVEDYALATLELSTGTVARLACSWRAPAGCDAQISVVAFGTHGGAAFRNVNGSFYDFVAERYRGTARERLCGPPDGWGGRAIVAWTQQLARSRAFDPAIESAITVANTLDRLYGRDATAVAVRPMDRASGSAAARR